MGNDAKKAKPKEQSSSDKMFDTIFEFKMMAKQMKKESAKAEQQEKLCIQKVKQAIENNLLDTAKIHAADAIRKKNESKRLLILSSKLEAVQSRLQSAYQTQQVIYFILIIYS
jgi:charged multivesicular body protein 1